MDDDGINVKVRSYANLIVPKWYATVDVPLTVADRIELGMLPSLLIDEDPSKYGVIDHPRTWQGFCDAIRGIMWVRYQAFEREGWAEFEAEDYAT